MLVFCGYFGCFERSKGPIRAYLQCLRLRNEVLLLKVHPGGPDGLDSEVRHGPGHIETGSTTYLYRV